MCIRDRNIAVSRNTVIEYATDQLLSKAGIKHAEINMPEIGQLPPVSYTHLDVYKRQAVCR